MPVFAPSPPSPWPAACSAAASAAAHAAQPARHDQGDPGAQVAAAGPVRRLLCGAQEGLLRQGRPGSDHPARRPRPSCPSRWWPTAAPTSASTGCPRCWRSATTARTWSTSPRSTRTTGMRLISFKSQNITSFQRPQGQDDRRLVGRQPVPVPGLHEQAGHQPRQGHEGDPPGLRYERFPEPPADRPPAP